MTAQLYNHMQMCTDTFGTPRGFFKKHTVCPHCDRSWAYKGSSMVWFRKPIVSRSSK